MSPSVGTPRCEVGRYSDDPCANRDAVLVSDRSGCEYLACTECCTQHDLQPVEEAS